MLKNCILILPVSDPAKQAAQVVKHHVFDERTDYLAGGDNRGRCLRIAFRFSPCLIQDLASCFDLMTDSAVVDSALVDAALRKSGLISNGKE